MWSHCGFLSLKVTRYNMICKYVCNMNVYVHEWHTSPCYISRWLREYTSSYNRDMSNRPTCPTLERGPCDICNEQMMVTSSQVEAEQKQRQKQKHIPGKLKGWFTEKSPI